MAAGGPLALVPEQAQDKYALHLAFAAQAVPTAAGVDLGETGPLSQGVQEGRKALRISHIYGMEVRKKRPRGFKRRPRGFK
jgi:hypothetical protein